MIFQTLPLVRQCIRERECREWVSFSHSIQSVRRICWRKYYSLCSLLNWCLHCFLFALTYRCVSVVYIMFRDCSYSHVWPKPDQKMDRVIWERKHESRNKRSRGKIQFHVVSTTRAHTHTHTHTQIRRRCMLWVNVAKHCGTLLCRCGQEPSKTLWNSKKKVFNRKTEMIASVQENTSKRTRD